MVEEGFALVVPLGCGIDVDQQLLQELQVGLLIKGLQ